MTCPVSPTRMSFLIIPLDWMDTRVFVIGSAGSYSALSTAQRSESASMLPSPTSSSFRRMSKSVSAMVLKNERPWGASTSLSMIAS